MLLINSTNHDDIIGVLQEAEVSAIHATNGTYAYPKEMIEPTPLYDAISKSGVVKMKSLHKWGYRTDPDAPKIEGAHNFATVYGFPLPNDTKPLCHDLTAYEDQSSFVEVVKLNAYLNRVEHGRVLPAPTNTL